MFIAGCMFGLGLHSCGIQFNIRSTVSIVFMLLLCTGVHERLHAVIVHKQVIKGVCLCNVMMKDYHCIYM